MFWHHEELNVPLWCDSMCLSRCWMRAFWQPLTVTKASSDTTCKQTWWNLSWGIIFYSAASRKIPIKWRYSSSFSSVDTPTIPIVRENEIHSSTWYEFLVDRFMAGVGEVLEIKAYKDKRTCVVYLCKEWQVVSWHVGKRFHDQMFISHTADDGMCVNVICLTWMLAAWVQVPLSDSASEN